LQRQNLFIKYSFHNIIWTHKNRSFISSRCCIMLPCLFLKKLRRKTTHEYVIYITRPPRIQCSTKTGPQQREFRKEIRQTKQVGMER